MAYTQTVGRRKTSVAEVRLTKGGATIVVNGRPFTEYFPLALTQKNILSPLKETVLEDTFEISAKISGGGFHGQAEAMRLGIARALVVLNPELRAVLKKNKFLSRDARKRERKKFGKKSARRSPQWAKR